jgi:ABC transport system ATP-binding/permease protein
LAAETSLVPGNWISDLNYDKFSEFVSGQAKAYVDTLSKTLRARNKVISDQRDALLILFTNRIGEAELQKLKDANHNENLANIVLNRMSTSKIYDAGKRYIQKADPVYMKPGSRYGRAHFYAPYKMIGNIKIGTVLFNVIAIWLMTIGLFVTLYVNALKRFIKFLETLNVPIWRKFGRELLQV